MSKFKIALVKFKDENNNFSTSINPKLSDTEIKRYYIGGEFNLGVTGDNVQICIGCEVLQATEK